MPVIQNTVAVAAGTTNDNIIQGSQFEFLPYNARIDFGLNGSAAGLVADVYSGTDTVAEQYGINALNRYPVWPDDYNLVDVAAAGERIKIRIQNPTGGALSIFYSVRVTPIV